MSININRPRTRAYFDKVEEDIKKAREEQYKIKVEKGTKMHLYNREEKVEPEEDYSVYEVNRMMEAMDDSYAERKHSNGKHTPPTKNEPNTRIKDTDWDEFFSDAPTNIPSEEDEIRETIMKRFKTTEYHGRVLTEELYGEMISNAILDYHNTITDSKKQEKPLVSWSEIRD